MRPTPAQETRSPPNPILFHSRLTLFHHVHKLLLNFEGTIVLGSERSLVENFIKLSLGEGEAHFLFWHVWRVHHHTSHYRWIFMCYLLTTSISDGNRYII